MKLRFKGESEWKDYKLYFNEDGSLRGVVFDEVKVKRPLASMNGKDETIEVSSPMLLPLDCFDMWEEPNWQSVRTQAAIAAMQGVMGFFGSIDYNRETIAKLAVEQADALIKELQDTSDGLAGVTIQKPIKDRIQPQPKQEWSEEDEHRIKDTIYFLDTAKKHYASTEELDACIDWIKSLRPQSQWKPSDEQMWVLSTLANIPESASDTCKKTAQELLEQLKKLMEE